MTASYHVLGFRLSGGSLYFGMTRSLNSYLQRIMEDDHSRSSDLKTAELCWILESEDEQSALALRSLLNELNDQQAARYATAHSLHSAEIRDLCTKHGFSIATPHEATSPQEGQSKNDPFAPLEERSETALRVPIGADRSWRFDGTGLEHLNPWGLKPYPDRHISIPDVLWFDPQTVDEAHGLGRLEALRPVAEVRPPSNVEWHRGSLIPLSVAGYSKAWSRPSGWAMGRYFSRNQMERHKGHPLSQAILESKDHEAPSESISSALQITAQRFLTSGPNIDFVISVPPQGDATCDRFEVPRQDLAEALGAKALSPEALRQRSDYPRMKSRKMTLDQRIGLREGRYLLDDSSIPGRIAGTSVLIIDDICTTGSTLGAVADALSPWCASCWFLTYAATQGKGWPAG